MRTTWLSLAALAALLAPHMASAQSAEAFMKNPAFADPPPAECTSTLDMQRCAAHDLRIADKQMSNAYFARRAALGPQARQRLLSEQRRWLTTRDRSCLAKRGEGTLGTVAVSQCWVTVTRARTRALAKWR